MDKGRAAGPAKEIEGTIKKVAGEPKLEPDGKSGKIKGKVQPFLAILDLMPGRRECAILLRHPRATQSIPANTGAVNVLPIAPPTSG